ncbi:DMT family transporter [Paenibacillus alvei]|uniref:Multidrug efflux SMR transporter n=1 Tax=Paenibacillus alvei TaxID=44250 RepID=A0AAP6ZYJ3_PAEAL|nr:multidrug efflux SMR transporter [Paenibacillus alvei]NEZ42390.1 QacE family quaternary ammonium compound efflux SMR transporter [Paenibacillus alvei]NOJ70482.1 multidrug efflux SMR transporter [Paenibacillus alvei]
MAWITLIAAGLLEVIGVIGIKRVAEKNNWPNNIMMIAAFFLSFKLLIGAMQTIPLSTAYAVWTGVGTVGSALVGMLIYQESKRPFRLLCIVGIIGCVVGLKLLD